MWAPRRGQAGFTLIEVTIVLAITLLIAALVYKATHAGWLLYRSQTHVTERGFSGVRAMDDMTVEIARAGFGLGDAGPLFAGTLEGMPALDAITLRSNPEGIVGVLEEDLVDSALPVPVEGAALFAAGDDVLLVDEEKTPERARVARVDPEALVLRSRETVDGQLRRPFLTALNARVLKVREVGFYLKTDRAGVVVLARKAPGQTEQVLARYVDALQFEYLGPARVPTAVRITLRLLPNPALPPVVVPPLSVLVPVEPQSAAIAFDAGAYHTIGLAGVIGQDPLSGDRKVRMHAWRNTIPRF
jgi:prepilin-type N-terminal cleavage/methylation domain-containing protein